MSKRLRVRIAALSAAGALALATMLPTFADVHIVSQAACSGNPNAGATQSRDAIELGRPAAPIPVTASGGPLPNNGGGDGDPFCDVK